MKLNEEAKGEIIGKTKEGFSIRNNPCGKTICNLWMLPNLGIKFCRDCNREQEKLEKEEKGS